MSKHNEKVRNETAAKCLKKPNNGDGSSASSKLQKTGRIDNYLSKAEPYDDVVRALSTFSENADNLFGETVVSIIFSSKMVSVEV